MPEKLFSVNNTLSIKGESAVASAAGKLKKIVNEIDFVH